MSAGLEEIRAFMSAEFPQSEFEISSVGDRQAVVLRRTGERDLRPGGTISGPTMMAMADTALYVAILGEIGLVALAVTTSLNFNFLRKPAGDKDLVGRCTLLKVGRSLIVGEVAMFSEGDERPVAHAVGTYSVPPG